MTQPSKSKNLIKETANQRLIKRMMELDRIQLMYLMSMGHVGFDIDVIRRCNQMMKYKKKRSSPSRCSDK